MKAKTPRPEGTGNETRPREIEPSAAAPRPDDRELEAVAFNAKEIDGRLQTTESGSVGIWPELRSMDLDPNDSPVAGWVAGFPVVDGVADSGWQEFEGGRLRLRVKVPDCPEQREWVRVMAYGGAHAREVQTHGGGPPFGRSSAAYVLRLPATTTEKTELGIKED